MRKRETPDYRALLKRSLLKLDELQEKLDALEAARNEPIAVVGLGCRFPRGANDPETFWRNLRDGVDGITEIPQDRWDVDAYYDPELGAPGKMYVRHGGFLDRVDGFDAAFFGIAPREAMRADPQHRLLLEVAWEALENAGQAPARLAGSATGVFVGIGSHDYAQLQTRLGTTDHIDSYFASGTAHSVANGRLAYVLGLQGPALSVDTACSSSLVAVHLACQSLRAGECNLALAGGVNLILAPDGSIATSQARMLSREGRSNAFDASADGYVRAEGCGIVVLKRLKDALAGRDRVLALIRGTAINQDGRSSGLTAPSGPAQEAVIREALAHSGLRGDQVAYVETHGTGTTLGDPIEVRALGAVLGPNRSPDRPLGIGSVKTNIGHTEAASGIAGLIKVVLSLQNEELPPHLHFRNPNPHIPWSQLPVRVVTERTPFPRGDLRRLVGVSSFGFSGTNCHLIVEEAPADSAGAATTSEPAPHLLCLSARSESALREMAARYERHLSDHPDVSLADVCFTACAGRSHFAERLALRARSPVEACERLADFREGREASGLAMGRLEGTGRPEIALLFTGQGSQYAGMGRELFETEAVFRRALERCEELLRPHLERPLLDVLFPVSGAASLLDETGYTQPALFAFEYALAETLRAWGIEPALVFGHSVGEYVAACVAGLFSLEDGLKLIAERARLMQGLPRSGVMAAVMADEDTVRAALAPYPESVSIAAVNAPGSVVVSGREDHVQAVVAELAKAGVKSQPLTVSHAFHSPLMEPILPALEAAAAGLRFAEPHVGIVSNLTGRLALPGEMARSVYWRRHAREAVRFAEGVKCLWEQGTRIFIEVGPSPTLLGLGRRCLTENGAAWLPTLRRGRPDRAQLLETLGGLYVRGVDLDWEKYEREKPRRRVALPTYPFERERLWLDSTRRGARPPGASAAPGKATGHALLGARLHSPQRVAVFEAEIASGVPAFVADHTFFGRTVFPATAYVEIALAAAREVGGREPTLVADVEIEEPLLLSDGDQVVAQTLVTPGADGEASLEVWSARAGDDAPLWRRHARCRLLSGSAPEPGAPSGSSLEGARSRCTEEVATADYYAAFAERGVHYGESFRCLERVWCAPGEALGRLRWPESATGDVTSFLVHPGLLDGGIQLLGAALSRSAHGDALYMPTGLARVVLATQIPKAPLAHAKIQGSPGDDVLRADVSFYDEAGRLVLEMAELTLRRVRHEMLARTEAQNVDGWLYALAWRRKPAAEVSAAGSAPGTWLVLADNGGVGEGLATRLREAGHAVRTVWATLPDAKVKGDRWDSCDPAGIERLLEAVPESGGPPLRGIVLLWGLDMPNPNAELSPEPIEAALAATCGSVLALVKALARRGDAQPPRVVLVTRGAQAVGPEPERMALGSAPLWGLLRTLAIEHPGLRPLRVDLDPRGEGADALWHEIAADGPEDQVAFRGGERFVARLVRALPEGGAPRWPAAGGDEESLQLRIAQRGVLDNLELVRVPRRFPGAGEVEIRVEASGLNFRDVLNALGMYPGEAGPLGGECAGRIVRVGEDVHDLAPGDAVLALAPAAFSTFVTTRADFVVKRPPGMSAEVAAGLPIAFLTAHYALQHLAGLKAGQRVLIHAAAGGVGLAAVQLALRAGAEVYGTAGSEEKRALLRAKGVAHVMDSRSLAFADELRERTQGRGVNVVLNSLSGEFIDRSLSVLGPGGWFLELGKRGIWDEERAQRFQPGISYRAFDLGDVLLKEPQRVRPMLNEVLAGLTDGSLAPLPLTTFRLARAAEAFRYMAQARHVGKIVLTQETAPAGASIRSDASYLVTGGLTGLGLVVARWLVARGARSLVLVGRRAPGDEARAVVEELRAAGASVHVAQADVTQAEALTRVLSEASGLPPLRGVFHSAGVLDDGVLVQQEWSRFERVLAPKLRGSLVLDQATRGLPLDFFVLFSSIASLLGSPGQGNYAAANAFLDALAHDRRARGLPALSVNWGPWGQVGMAARLSERDHRRREEQGVALLEPEAGCRALERLLEAGLPQSAVLRAEWGRVLRALPAGATTLLYQEITAAARAAAGAPARITPQAGSFLRQLEETPEVERRERVVAHVREQVGKVLGLDPSRLTGLNDSLTGLGMDSLMAVELRSRLEASLGRTLPATLAQRLFEGPTVGHLAEIIEALLWAAQDVQPAPSVAVGDREELEL